MTLEAEKAGEGSLRLSDILPQGTGSVGEHSDVGNKRFWGIC